MAITPTDPTFIEIAARTFVMGTHDPKGYAADGEGPPHEVTLDGFAISAHAITNAQFQKFVTSTGYVTLAQRHGASFVFGGLLPPDFPPTRAVAATPWWREVEGADWAHPEGPQSTIEGRGQHPVVHVSWVDAAAYCGWAQARLPTEAEWECAARGGIEGSHFPWGDELQPDGTHMMNVFQGQFPNHNTVEDGWAGTCPVGAYAPNEFGLFETTGNVWEWCSDWFDPAYYTRSPSTNPSGPDVGRQRVLRGGSYMCHESYCWRYRTDSRSSNTPDTTIGNVGFRIARDS